MKQVNEYIDHKERVGTIAWGNPILASGSRDKNIIFRDLRMPKITQISKRVGKDLFFSLLSNCNSSS